MQLNLTPQEKEAFIALANSEAGRVFTSFLKRMKAELGDITTITGVDIAKEVQTRRDVINIINLNIIDRFKVFSGEVAPTSNKDEYV